jgi:hypothetical protein
MNSTIYSSLSFLRKIHACDEAITYASAQPDFQSIWNNCPRGDWLIWLASLLRAPQKLVVQVSIECVRPVLKLIPGNEYVIIRCNKWVNGTESTRSIESLSLNLYDYLYKHNLSSDNTFLSIIYVTNTILALDPSTLAAYSHEVIRKACDVNPETKSEMLNKCANIVRKIIKIDDLNVSLLNAQN